MELVFNKQYFEVFKLSYCCVLCILVGSSNVRSQQLYCTMHNGNMLEDCMRVVTII
jgi:hypothetical protein